MWWLTNSMVLKGFAKYEIILSGSNQMSPKPTKLYAGGVLKLWNEFKRILDAKRKLDNVSWSKIRFTSYASQQTARYSMELQKVLNKIIEANPSRGLHCHNPLRKATVAQFARLSETQRSCITWLLQSFNPVPLEFYRFLNRKTKHIAVNGYLSALSHVLEMSDEMPEEKRVLFGEIQQKWKDGMFNSDWTVYAAERSALSSIKTSISVQKDFNSEVSSHCTKKRKYDPSTPNKPVIRVDMEGLYPQISFEKKIRFAASESNNDEATASSETGSLLNPFEVPQGTETDSGQNQIATWRKWLEYILEVPIEDVRIKILTLPYSNKNKFEATMIQYIGKVLMDFVNKVIDVPGNVLFIDDIERDWIISKLSPLFVYLEATFINRVRFHWQVVEHDIEPTHERLVRDGNTTNKDRLKADMVGVRLCDNRQIVFLEMSGAPTDFLQPHTITDVHKTIQERIDAVNSLLLNFLDYDVRYAGKIRSLTVQGIRDRLTLRSIFLRGKEDYFDEEILSAIFPLSWELRFQFLEIFELTECIMLSIIEYPNVIKELRKHRADSLEFSIRHCLSN
ncbi:4296_t:CDS:10 [Ambispora leptoticha]|uniref:4296_t:CDS:1 n=1 Tax=Ambispora leptoticha TaxID=144679 RepID=A0A9N8WH21_9GLOM|nr:4296_t:CDS:10 [Ambispora leptoticha]